MESHLAISGNRKFSSLSNNRDWKGIYTKDCYLWFANLTTYTSNGIKNDVIPNVHHKHWYKVDGKYMGYIRVQFNPKT